MTRLLHLLILLLVATSLRAQPSLRFVSYGVDEGLSSAYINGVAKGPDGFVWFGTAFGVNRFDGYRFHSYRHDSKDPTSLADDYVRDVFTDPAGRLWIGTEGGLSHYRPATDDFATYLRDTYVRQIAADGEGDLWLATNRGVIEFDPAAGEVLQAIAHQPDSDRGLATDDVLAIVVAGDEVWIGSNRGGLARLSTRDGEIVRYRAGDGAGALSNDSVLSLHADRQGELWIGTAAGLNRYDRERDGFSQLSVEGGNIATNVIFAIAEDDRGALWFGSYGGLNRYDRAARRGQLLRHDSADRSSIPGDRIRSLFIDDEGLLWVATTAGVGQHDLDSGAFGHFRNRAGVPDSLSSSYVWSILSDSRERLWIGSQGGLDLFDLASGRSARHYAHDSEDPASLRRNVVHAVYEDRGQRIWVATDGGGLSRLNDDEAGFTHFRHDPDDPRSLSDDQVKSVFEDSAGTLWVGTVRGGANRRQPDGTFTHYRPITDDERSLPHDNVYAFAEDSQRRLWIATRDGLARHVPATDDFLRFQNRPDDPTSLSNSIVLSLLVDRQDRLWVGTRGGLNRWREEDGAFDRWQTAQGLADDTVYALEQATDGSLWLSTNAGLSRFDPETGRFENFVAADGLQSKEFNSGASTIDRDGMLYFGGPAGFNAFRPDELVRRSVPTPIVLTDFLLFNRSVPWGSGSRLTAPPAQLRTLRLGPEDAIFAFEFSALGFRQPERSRFRYRLLGLNDDWLETTAEDRKAVYTNVPHGTYEFQVTAANAAGRWEESPLSLALIVDPPWWLTWWMKTVYWIVGIGAPVAFYLMRLSTYRRRQRELEEQVALRTEQVVSQRDQIEGQAQELRVANERLLELDEFKQDMTGMIVHDLKNPLNAILSGLDHSVADSDRSVLRKSARQMLYLVMNILDVQKFETAAMTPDRQASSLHALAKRAIDQVSFLRGGRTIENHLSPRDLVLVDPEVLDRVLVNFLTNAIKFTGDAGRIMLRQGATAHGRVRVEIIDDGEGIAAADQAKVFDRFAQASARNSGRTGSTGLGLSYCRLAIEAHGGEIGVTSELGRGTTFFFTLATAPYGEIVNAHEATVEPPAVPAIALPEANRALFLERVDGLASTPAYRVTELNRRLDEIEQEFGAPIAAWLNGVRDALAAADEARFARRLQEAKELVSMGDAGVPKDGQP
ncbi:MAG: two-component regulator propeller domain-containing protein [Pseudomonadota bacterium]